jgi:hypothetical protein
MHDPTIPFPATPAQIQQLVARFQQQQGVLGPSDKKISRRKFSPEEDDMLRTVVTQLGHSDWSVIARHLPNRTPRQCRDRWKHYISPEVVTGNWTEADDQLLMSKVQELGQKWSTITQLFPGRTDIGVKNRYISLTGRGNKGWDKGRQSGPGAPGLDDPNYGAVQSILPTALMNPSGGAT